ncbi:MAG: penicillin acylase family protein [Aquimonas sp.]|nr:penicillin acylase family protein [Aquimonas sp.]
MHVSNTAASRLSALTAGILLSVSAGLAGAQALPAPGLKANGSISYDAEGVPTITAATDEDAAWLMGYAHARDRFFQMDLLRRTASGTLAELVGPSVLPRDIELRTLGLRRAAWATWAKTSPELRGQLKAYADGVNTWLATHPVPTEHQALELSSADSWSPVDSLVIGKLLAFQLSFDLDIDYTVRLGAYQQAGAAAGFNGSLLFFEDTHRSMPADSRLSVPGFLASIGGMGAPKIGKGAVQFDPADAPIVDAQLMQAAQNYVERVRDNPIIGPQLSRRENRAGSNWWAVAGQHTASGAPILANDPHLGLDTPMLFHEGHVISNDPRYPTPMNTVGAIAPGTPVPILGCNSHFCWGLTTNPMDVTDSYSERFVLNTFGLPTHTIYQGQIEPVLWVFQSFFANSVGDGRLDSVSRVNSIGYTNGGITVLVPRRNNGPVLSITGNTGISVAYTGWGPTQELESFRRVNRATNLEEFRAALQFFDVGSQNFAYADKQGNIAYFATAEAPIREDLQRGEVVGAPPFIIRSGQGGNEWLPRQNTYPAQAVPFEVLSPAELPQSVNPASGYIANANNDPVGNTLDNNVLNQLRPGGGIYYLAPGYSSYRQGRIDRELQRLIARGGISIEDMAELQANTQFLDAELVLPHLLAAFDRSATASIGCSATLVRDTQLADAIALLRGWDFSAPTGIREGYDRGDDPFNLPEPSEAQIRASAAATIWSVYRGQLVRNVVDGTLARVGLGNFLPGNNEAYTAVKFLLDNFDSRQGRGASGLDFFQGVPASAASESAANRRDCVLLTSLRSGLNLLSSEAFAPAFANSSNLLDYRWGRLHRIVLDHPLGGPFNLPGQNAYPFRDLSPQLPGLARPGGYEVVDASGHGVRANTVNGFMFGSGPVRRFIGEMTDPPTLLQIMPGGQDGKIGGPGYISQLPRWLVNDYKPLVLDPAQSQAGEVARIEFTPR